MMPASKEPSLDDIRREHLVYKESGPARPGGDLYLAPAPLPIPL